MALEFCERFSQEVARADNKLEMAVRLAIAGNVIDLGVKSNLDESQVHEAIETCLTEPLDGDIQHFAAAIAGATRILYLTDNAGEIVLDRLLIEQLPREKVTVAVKGAPVINDATRVDAETAGITGLVTVIDNGSDAPGTILEDCSDVFRRHFDEADLIIAKGQGNYETLREVPRPLYFLLRVKCPVLACDLGCPLGRMVLRPASPLPPSAPAQPDGELSAAGQNVGGGQGFGGGHGMGRGPGMGGGRGMGHGRGMGRGGRGMGRGAGRGDAGRPVCRSDRDVWRPDRGLAGQVAETGLGRPRTKQQTAAQDRRHGGRAKAGRGRRSAIRTLPVFRCHRSENGIV